MSNKVNLKYINITYKSIVHLIHLYIKTKTIWRLFYWYKVLLILAPSQKHTHTRTHTHTLLTQWMSANILMQLKKYTK